MVLLPSANVAQPSANVGPTICHQPTQIAGTCWANVGIWHWPNVGYPRWANVILLIGPTGWHEVGPTWVCTTLPLGQRWANVGLYCTAVGPVLGQCGCYTCMLYFHCANVGPTWVCTTLLLGQRRFVLHFYWASVGPMWLLHVYVVFSLRQRWANMGLYYTSTRPMWLYFHWASIGLMHTYSIGVFCWANVYLFCELRQ